jgi:hypothetical protein
MLYFLLSFALFYEDSSYVPQEICLIFAESDFSNFFNFSELVWEMGDQISTPSYLMKKREINSDKIYFGNDICKHFERLIGCFLWNLLFRQKIDSSF